MADTFREELRASLTEARAAEGGGDADGPDPVVVGSGDAAGPSESLAPPPEADGAPSADSAPRARDASGKFAKTEESATQAPKAAKPTVTPKPTNGAASPTQAPAPGTTTPTPPPKYKAPASWSPMEREHWASLKEEAQAVIDRREREMEKAQREAAEPRKFHQSFQQAVAPYQAMIQASGGDPVKYTQNLLQTAYQLQSGTPTQKAQLLAHLVKEYGVDIGHLDSALSGTAAPQGQGASQSFDPNQFRQQIKAELMQDLRERQQKSQQAQIAREVEEFGRDREFFSELSPDMDILLARAGEQGRAMNLEQAYNQAKRLHLADDESEIGKVLRQREQAKQAETAQAATQRARAASTSVKSEPNGLAPSRDSGSYRDSLRQLMAERNRG